VSSIVRVRPSARQRDSYRRGQIDEEWMKLVMKKFPGTKWADLAAFHLIENKLCGDWQAASKCPDKEADMYEKYAKEHEQSPSAPEALRTRQRLGTATEIWADLFDHTSLPLVPQPLEHLAEWATKFGGASTVATAPPRVQLSRRVEPERVRRGHSGEQRAGDGRTGGRQLCRQARKVRPLARGPGERRAGPIGPVG